MISHPGYDKLIERVYKHGQEHVFEFWDSLTADEKTTLLDELAGVDFEGLASLFARARESEGAASGFKPAPCITLPETEAERARFAKAREAGRRHIEEGRVAAFVVAGGQGTRLGFDGPKGVYRVGPVSGKSLFQIHAEKILKSSMKYGASIPWLVMTSQANHDDTLSYLCENRYFGLDERDVIVFPQGMIPSLDVRGRLILEGPCRLFRNPDGHGGSLGALASSGALAELERRGIETISYFQVDNPLVSIIDPVFVGFHVLEGAEVSSKALEKAYPEEKIGVFVEFADRTLGVMEYSDLSLEMQRMRDESGRLLYRMGSIAVHLFSRDFVKRLTTGAGLRLPFHVAKKKIKAYAPGGVREIEGYKFEKFVFDALPLTARNVILETRREEEFAPVKNKSGVDSVESARELMSALHKSWLLERGVHVPPEVEVVEISPLLAIAAEDLSPDISVPRRREVYLDAAQR